MLTQGHTQAHRCRICAALARVLLARGLLMVGPTDGAKHLLLVQWRDWLEHFSVTSHADIGGSCKSQNRSLDDLES